MEAKSISDEALLGSWWNSIPKLHPPNDRPHVVLPTSDMSVHYRPMTNASVIAVYPTALSFVDHISAMRGYLGVGAIGAPSLRCSGWQTTSVEMP